MEREHNAGYGEGEEFEKTVEEKKPGQDSPAGVWWRRALHVIGLRAVIFF